MFTNYKFVITDDKVIAISRFAGKTVKGVAKCHPNDTFDVEKGKKLAAARCNSKIAEKRFRRARSKYLEATKIYHEANELLYDRSEYVTNSYKAFISAIEEEKNILGEIMGD